MEPQPELREVVNKRAEYVKFPEFTKGVFEGWKTVMGEGKYDMVTRDYSDQSAYSQIVERGVERPNGVTEPLIVEKADETVVQREILYERWEEWEEGRLKVIGERETFVDSDGEVTVRLRIVDEKDRILKIYTKGTNESFYQETLCRLSQTTENQENALIADAEKLIAAARKLGLPLDYSIFEERLIGKIGGGGIEVNRHRRAIYEDLFSKNYRKREVVSDDKYVLPGSGENKARGHVPPLKEVK